MAGNELGREVNITPVDPASWLEQTDSLVKTIRYRPMTTGAFRQDSDVEAVAGITGWERGRAVIDSLIAG